MSILVLVKSYLNTMIKAILVTILSIAQLGILFYTLSNWVSLLLEAFHNSPSVTVFPYVYLTGRVIWHYPFTLSQIYIGVLTTACAAVIAGLLAPGTIELEWFAVLFCASTFTEIKLKHIKLEVLRLNFPTPLFRAYLIAGNTLATAFNVLPYACTKIEDTSLISKVPLVLIIIGLIGCVCYKER